MISTSLIYEVSFGYKLVYLTVFWRGFKKQAKIITVLFVLKLGYFNNK